MRLRASPLTWIGRLVGMILAGYLGYVSIEGSRRLTRPGRRAFEPLEGYPSSPADLGLEYEDVRFTTADGVTLSGWLVPAARETHTAVILMHGYGWHRLPDLLHFVPWLQREHHVLQFDFRGHGHSGDSVITLGAQEQRDVGAAVRFLEGRGLGPIALMGISMGASTAIVAAGDLPVAAVVADAPFADCRHPVANVLRREHIPLAWLGAWIITLSAAVRVRNWLVNPIDRVRRIAPRGLLIIAPREDALISWHQSLKLYRAAGDPKELYVVDGAEHSTARATAVEEYERRVLSFLRRHLDDGDDGSGSQGPPSVRESDEQRL
jgi:uncharacterized protein